MGRRTDSQNQEPKTKPDEQSEHPFIGQGKSRKNQGAMPSWAIRFNESQSEKKIMKPGGMFRKR
jgi:hypothetical protein